MGDKEIFKGNEAANKKECHSELVEKILSEINKIAAFMAKQEKTLSA